MEDGGPIKFDDLVRISGDGPVPYEKFTDQWGNQVNRLRMKGVPSPLSIMEREFNFIKDFVSEGKFLFAYEIATGFGISSLAIGLGLKPHKGRLLTLDAYIEEYYDSGHSYEHRYGETFSNMNGWKSVKFLIEHYGLEETIFPRIGWSPEDVRPRLWDIFDLRTDRLDFVFIDGGHFHDWVVRDIDAIYNILADEFVIMLHDRTMFDDRLTEFLVERFGSDSVEVPGTAYPNGCHLAIIDKRL
jgi:hypothetical protein